MIFLGQTQNPERTTMTTPAKPLLQVENLVKHFQVADTGAFFRRKTNVVHAVDGISFNLYKGETLGLVGESGCGKSTAGRTILQLYRPTSGEIIFDGKDLTKLRGNDMRL